MIDIDDLEKKEKAATPGEWIHNQFYDAILDGNVEWPMYSKICEEPTGMKDQINSDFSLIVALRNNAREIIDELRILQTLRKINPPQRKEMDKT
jgi:hypothetical protein